MPARHVVLAKADVSAVVSKFSTDLQFESKQAAEWMSQFSSTGSFPNHQFTVSESVLLGVSIINKHIYTH